MKKPVAKNFAYSQKGLATVLGSLEKEVMDVLWSGNGLTGKEVHAILISHREIAVTTVFTVLERLSKKGLVSKEKRSGLFVFSPAYSKDELGNIVSNEVLRSVIELSGASAVSNFVDILASKDPSELDRLASIISRKKSELKKGS